MAGDEQRHQLVAELLRRSSRAVLVARLQQQREDVVAPRVGAPRRRGGLISSRSTAWTGPIARGKPVHPRFAEPLRADQAAMNSRAGERRTVEHRPEAARQRARTVRRRSTPKTARRITSSVIACMRRPDRERLAERPGGDLALGDLPHHLAVALHALAVERGQQQLALAQVRRPVEQEHRFATDDRAKDRVGLAAQYLTSSSEASVGGDWYEGFLLGEGKIALIVGDVVGHGITAAADMALIRGMMSALLHAQIGDFPDLHRVNQRA